LTDLLEYSFESGLEVIVVAIPLKKLLIGVFELVEKFIPILFFLELRIFFGENVHSTILNYLYNAINIITQYQRII